MSRPDAPSPSAFSALADVDYNEDAWERKVDRWTIAFSLRRSEDDSSEDSSEVDIRDKQIGFFDNNDVNDVCRGTDIFRSICDHGDVEDFDLITISCDDKLYAFCMFDKDYKDEWLPKEYEYMRKRVIVKDLCTAKNSFTGTGTFILALLTKYALACTFVSKLVISAPLPPAEPFYKNLGFTECEWNEETDENEMEMWIYDESDGVHFAPMEEMRGTKRPRSESLVLLVV